jgi:hypothetical protein
MKHTLYPLLVKVFPRAWQERFKDEFLALLETQPLTFRSVVDILRAALDAHCQPQSWSKLSRLERSRNAQLNLFLTFVLFAFTLLVFFKQSEHLFDALLSTHPEINFISSIVAFGWMIACLIFSVASLPLLWQSLLTALKHHRSRLWLYSAPAFLLTSFITFTIFLLFAINNGVTLPLYLRSLWQTDCVVTVFVSAILIRIALHRSPLEPKLIRYSQLFSHLLKASMVILTIVTLTWGFSIWRASPTAFYKDHFPFTFLFSMLFLLLTTNFNLLKQLDRVGVG